MPTAVYAAPPHLLAKHKCSPCTQINPYMSNPCHIEVIVSEKDEAVKKADDKRLSPLTSRQRARLLTRQRTITAA